MDEAVTHPKWFDIMASDEPFGIDEISSKICLLAMSQCANFLAAASDSVLTVWRINDGNQNYCISIYEKCEVVLHVLYCFFNVSVMEVTCVKVEP